MIIRPLDEFGDVMPIRNVDQMISGAQAVSQIINLRLHFFYGEWWEDETIGFRIPDFLIANVRKGDTDLISKYISAYISNSEGVRAVTGISTEYNNHVIKFICSVLTREGQDSTVEVTLNGIQ